MKWNIILAITGAACLIMWTIYCEVDYHYLTSYDGIVVEKQQIPPKNMPDLLINGTQEIFPTWKWEGIDFDSVKVGDSISKKKYDSDAYYFKKLSDGKYSKRKLKYWSY